MSTRLQTLIKTSTTVPVFTPVRTSLPQRNCACGGTRNEECEECKRKRLQRSALQVQPKLAISQPRDAFEQEADCVAHTITSQSVTSISSLTPDNNSDPAGIGLAPSIVGEVLRSSGQPLDSGTTARMTQRFGYDFGRVRVHTDARANESAQAVNAHAYTVGEHIVFGRGRYAPSTVAGQNLLAHELTHVVQQPAGQTIRRSPAPARKLPDPTLDEIAREIGPALGGPYADYAAYASTMVSGSFLGHPIVGKPIPGKSARPELIAKLPAAKSAIDAEFAKSGRAIPPGYGISSVGGFRWAAGPHGWGLAIDLDVPSNPFVMHEKDEATLDAQLAPVYHRIAEFIMNSPVGGQQSIIPTIITQHKNLPGSSAMTRADRLGEYYDRLQLESQAMQDYFGLMKNPATNAIANFLAGPWQQKHPAASGAAPAPDDVRRQMWEDYATLGGAIPTGGPPGITGYMAPGAIGTADRPFLASAGQQDPAKGFLTIPREVVIGLGQTLTRWGAIDFWGQSGDVQHFDDMEGIGVEISAATARAKAKIAAAATTTGVTP